MIKALLLAIIVCLNVVVGNAQCIAIDVTAPAEVCRQTTFSVENNTLAASFEWDLCPFDLQSTPTISKVMNTGLSSTIDLELAEDGGQYYGFVVDAQSNSLVRLDFGNSRDNLPAKVDLGNIDGQFEFPNSVAIARQNDNWIGIVANGGNQNIILLNFGNSLANLPASSLLHTRAVGGFANITIAPTSGEGRALVIAEYNAKQVTVLNYPDGFMFPSDIQQTVLMSGSSPIDVQVVEECDQWKAIVLSFDDKQLYKLDFGTSFANSPVISSYGFVFGFEPYRLSIEREGDFYTGFVSSTSGGLSRLDFENSVDNTPVVGSIGSFGVLSNSRSLFVDSKDGQWRAFMINYSDGDLFRLSFQADCGVSPLWSSGFTPGEISYSVAGTQRITVAAFEADGTVSTAGYPLTVKDELAPQFTIQSTNYCVDNLVYFRAENTDGTIEAFQWQFGDGNGSSAADPSHVYSTSNTYQVSLKVTGQNSCVNEKKLSLGIFDEPQSDFSLPSSTPLCTNQNLTFVNTSVFQENSAPYWKWIVNSVEVSAEKDLLQSLNTPGPHIIKLIAGIPGCESQSEQTLGPLSEGPSPGFSYTGLCLGEVTEFVNSSSGDIESYQWEFGDGHSSSQENPIHTFEDTGEYEVALTAMGTNGCEARKTEMIQIRSVPLPDFQIFGPPSSCSGTSSFFDNQSTNPDGEEIKGWLWSFNDSSSDDTATEENPEHVFAAAGVYEVSLSATTAFGCMNTTQKEVIIYQSPDADFTFTTACEEIPVTFSTISGSGIVGWYWEIGTSYYTIASPTHTFRTPGSFSAYVEVTADNNCVASMRKNLDIPQRLLPDFSVLKNCVDHEAIFTDITAGIDPVIARQWWTFDGESLANTSPVTHVFSTPGPVNVTLEVTAESGCTYRNTKEVQIVLPPQAGFSASPQSGAYPLEVEFTNLSSEATGFHWQFMDGTGQISQAPSPTHTFYGEGSYDVILTAFNDQQCQHSLTQSITTVAPLPDADIELLSVVPNPDGSARLIVTIQNHGNTIIRSLPLIIDLGESVTLQAVVNDPIFPGAKHNFVLNPAIMDIESLQYLCVSLEVHDDRNPQGNRMCKDFQDRLFAFPAYPNPAAYNLNVEWISTTSGPVKITFIDAPGRQIFSRTANAAAGLNRQRISVDGLRHGLYLLVIEDGVTRSIQRIAVQETP